MRKVKHQKEIIYALEKGRRHVSSIFEYVNGEEGTTLDLDCYQKSLNNLVKHGLVTSRITSRGELSFELVES